MDNLTHTLSGLMLSRAGLHRFTPRASLLLMLAANMPDIDVVSGLWSAESYFHFHRWYTHAALLVPVVAVLPVLLVRLITKGSFPWRNAYLVSLIGTASHPLLDYTNAYGIRLFLPFSDVWPALDITNVVDVWIWAALLLAVAAPLLSRLVSSEIGARRTGGRGWAIFALVFLLAYNSGRYLLKQRAIAVQEARLYHGAPPLRVNVVPTAVNPFYWRGIVETEEFFIVQDVPLRGELDPTTGRIFHKSEASPLFDHVRNLRVFRNIRGFSRALLWRAVPDPELEGGTQVQALDLRLGFSANAVVASSGEVVRTWFSFSPDMPGRQPR